MVQNVTLRELYNQSGYSGMFYVLQVGKIQCMSTCLCFMSHIS